MHATRALLFSFLSNWTKQQFHRSLRTIKPCMVPLLQIHNLMMESFQATSSVWVNRSWVLRSNALTTKYCPPKSIYLHQMQIIATLFNKEIHFVPFSVVKKVYSIHYFVITATSALPAIAPLNAFIPQRSADTKNVILHSQVGTNAGTDKAISDKRKWESAVLHNQRQFKHFQRKSPGTLITLEFSPLMFHSNVRIGSLTLQCYIPTEVEDLRLELRSVLKLSRDTALDFQFWVVCISQNHLTLNLMRKLLPWTSSFRLTSQADSCLVHPLDKRKVAGCCCG